MKKRMCIFLIFLLLTVTFCLPAAAEETPHAGTVATSSGTLNIRQSPSTAASVVGKLSKGTIVTLLEKSGNWWKVQYSKSNTGYCSANYITPIASSQTAIIVTAGSNLNVRTGPGTEYAVKGSLANQSKVVRIASKTGWSRIVYNGIETGYVNNNYLKVGTNTNITLSVPFYLQTDSRWRNVTLGSSNATIGKSGCATCCLAMTESYRLHTSKTPAVMAKSLSYTAGGSVYWPTNYRQTTNAQNYLGFIYEKLQAGTPVILGLKTNTGGMHFVVITGCTGNKTSTSAYQINDPGTASRTNLAQVLAVYPNFYKMLWAV